MSIAGKLVLALFLSVFVLYISGCQYHDHYVDPDSPLFRPDKSVDKYYIVK